MLYVLTLPLFCPFLGTTVTQMLPWTNRSRAIPQGGAVVLAARRLGNWKKSWSRAFRQHALRSLGDEQNASVNLGFLLFGDNLILTNIAFDCKKFRFYPKCTSNPWERSMHGFQQDLLYISCSILWGMVEMRDGSTVHVGDGSLPKDSGVEVERRGQT